MTDPVVLSFAKGHGTENDFIIVPDPDAERELNADDVRALCDRRAGIGADGVLRVVLAAKHPEALDQASLAEWFMDYRNADGSVAEMCGNGARVFAYYLVTEGLAEAGVIPVATRDGVKQVEVHVDADTTGAGGAACSTTVQSGLPQLGASTTVEVDGVTFVGRIVSVGNPHAVCVLESPLAELDLTRQPRFDADVFADGVNIEFITPPVPCALDSADLSGSGALYTRMRVYERGSGETRSCGTGAIAVAAVALATASTDTASVSTGTVWIDLPGGRARVTVTEQAAFLTGNTVIVAKGHCFL